MSKVVFVLCSGVEVVFGCVQGWRWVGVGGGRWKDVWLEGWTERNLGTTEIPGRPIK